MVFVSTCSKDMLKQDQGICNIGCSSIPNSGRYKLSPWFGVQVWLAWLAWPSVTGGEKDLGIGVQEYWVEFRGTG